MVLAATSDEAIALVREENDDWNGPVAFTADVVNGQLVVPHGVWLEEVSTPGAGAVGK